MSRCWQRLQGSCLVPRAFRCFSTQVETHTATASASVDQQALLKLVSSFQANAEGAATRLAETLDASHRLELLRALQKVENSTAAAASQGVKNDDPSPAIVPSKQKFQEAVFHAEKVASKEAVPARPAFKALRLIFLASAIPFVGFGFLDNFIMTMAGDEIDALFGARFGLSTLASAGLGNLLADVAGIGFANSIEQAVRKLKWAQQTGISKAQASLPITKWTKATGASVGVMIGCLLGLTPLLFLEHKHH